MSEWISVEDRLPERDEIVLTKIHDVTGERNHTRLKRIGHLWFVPDGSMYVYYRVTHWMPLPDPPETDDD